MRPEELENKLKTLLFTLIVFLLGFAVGYWAKNVAYEDKIYMQAVEIESLKENIDILINNAGFGTFGEFTKTDLQTELNMIDTNIKAVHILTKSFLKDMEKRNSGYILNVASSAAFQPGPLMSTYYATKSYVYQLSEALWYEQKKKKSKVQISVLCPGPVDTNFNAVAGVKFGVKPLESTYVAKYAIDEMMKGKMLIIPGFTMKCAKFFGRFVSDKFLLRCAYRIQKKKAK